VAHQGFGARQGHFRHATDRALRGAGFGRRLREDLGRAVDAPDGRRVRAQDNGAARLDGNQRLVEGGGGRIGRRNDPGDDAEGLCKLDDPRLVIAANHPDRLHRPDVLMHPFAAEPVLDDLVFVDAESSFVDGEAGEGGGVLPAGGSHRVDDGVDLLLGEFPQRPLRAFRAAGERARLLRGPSGCRRMGRPAWMASGN
jgi:hypothetical protein